MFDPSARVAVLNPAGRAQARSIVPQTPVVPVGQPNNIEALASLIQGIGGLVNRAPQTPVRSIITDHPIISPNIPSPSQLTRFLAHAETHLGVYDASLYKTALRRQRYGPDVLHRVPDSDLTKLGIHPGDVIRLKDGAVIWWKGPDAKRKRDQFEPEPQDALPAKHTVAYERRFTEGGGSRFSAGPMVGGDPPNAPGETIWYRCEARQDWFPIPPGYTVEEENNEDDSYGF
jgi:hypothetical protein